MDNAKKACPYKSQQSILRHKDWPGSLLRNMYGIMVNSVPLYGSDIWGVQFKNHDRWLPELYERVGSTRI